MYTASILAAASIVASAVAAYPQFKLFADYNCQGYGYQNIAPVGSCRPISNSYLSLSAPYVGSQCTCKFYSNPATNTSFGGLLGVSYNLQRWILQCP